MRALKSEVTIGINESQKGICQNDKKKRKMFKEKKVKMSILKTESQIEVKQIKQIKTWEKTLTRGSEKKVRKCKKGKQKIQELQKVVEHLKRK